MQEYLNGLDQPLKGHNTDYDELWDLVDALDKEAQRLAKEGYKYILTPEKPNLREVRWHPIGEE